MAPAPVVADPHGLGTAVARLGNAGRKSGKVALAVASALLTEGEIVECVVVGKVNDLDGAAVLTNLRLLLVNDRQWLVDQVSFRVDAGLVVQGISEGSSATVTFQREGVAAQVARVGDVALAQELAQRIRARAATG